MEEARRFAGIRIDARVNPLDTADMHSYGKPEEVPGQAPPNRSPPMAKGSFFGGTFQLMP